MVWGKSTTVVKNARRCVRLIGVSGWEQHSCLQKQHGKAAEILLQPRSPNVKLQARWKSTIPVRLFCNCFNQLASTKPATPATAPTQNAQQFGSCRPSLADPVVEY